MTTSYGRASKLAALTLITATDSHSLESREARRSAKRASVWISCAAVVFALTLSPLMVTRASAQATPAAAPSPAAAVSVAAAASPAASPSAAPSPLPNPAVTGPLQTSAPYVIETGIPTEFDIGGSDFQHISVDGVFSGIGIAQTNTPTTDRNARLDMSNAMLSVQQPTGLVQFYLQGGAYDIPALGTPLVTTGKALSNLYGPLPVAFLKLAPTDSFSIEGGNLPTLIGAEYTFTFENVNVERGLLWNQENAINRGVQVNYATGPLSAAVSWNNGFYSRSYTWLWGSLAWAINPTNTLSVIGGKNLGTDKHNTFNAPVFQNNSGIFNLIYTLNAAPWIIQPYFQWTSVPRDNSIGVSRETSTFGGALLASYAFTNWFALAGRAEYIAATGNNHDGSVNLLYGAGSEAWSLTATPTFQWKDLFARPEFSFIRATNYSNGTVFGASGNQPTQFRALLELGLLF